MIKPEIGRIDNYIYIYWHDKDGRNKRNILHRYKTDVSAFSEIMLDTLSQGIVDSLCRMLILEDNKSSYYLFNIYNKKITKLILIDFFEKKSDCYNMAVLDEQKIKNGYRMQTMDTLIKNLRKYTDTLFHTNFGLFDKAFRNASDICPMVSIEFKQDEMIYSGHGRTKSMCYAFYYAVLESLERLHGVHSFRDTVLATEQELANIDFISMKQLLEPIGYRKNINVNSFDRSKKYSWEYIYSVKHKKYLLIPSQFLHFGHLREEERYIGSTSNGMAMGANLTETYIASMLEVIERDSFLVHWYTATAPKKINNVDNVANETIQRMLAAIDEQGYKLYFFDITTDTSIPAVWILFESTEREENLAYYTAASSHFDIESAIESALIEGMSSIKSLLAYFSDGNMAYPKDKYHIHTLDDHVLYYSAHKPRTAFDFAKNTGQSVDLSTLISCYKEEFGHLTNQKEIFNFMVDQILSIQGIDDIWFADMSSSFLEVCNLKCTKIIVPGLQDISFGYDKQNINMNRLTQFCKFKEKELVLNEDPHPFP